MWQLRKVTSEIMPMLSPKQAPPAIAPTVRIWLPPTMWLSQRKIGAQAAKVPQEEPVAKEMIQVTSMDTAATLRPVMPSSRAILIMEAPTPVRMKHSATVVANIRIKKIRMIFLVATMPDSNAPSNEILVVSI